MRWVGFGCEPVHHSIGRSNLAAVGGIVCAGFCARMRAGDARWRLKVGTGFLFVVKLRRASRWYGCKPVQGLRAGALVREVRQ
jgi:hypothetical protein